MNEHQLHDAIGDISEALLAPVAKLRQKKRYPVAKWAAAAACLCLLLSLPFTWNTLNGTRAESMANTAVDLELSTSDRFSGLMDKTDDEAEEGIAEVTVFRARCWRSGTTVFW